MPAVPETNPIESCQARFHRRWQHLNDPHVRALAWLLDAPDLLDPQAPQWRGLIATLTGVPDRQAIAWLAELDAAPDALHAYLDIGPYTRLGRYAEKLMAFYFQHRGTLFAHGIQVRAGKNHTVGEFDFLLREGDALLHLEFATKFYLLESSGAGSGGGLFRGAESGGYAGREDAQDTRPPAQSGAASGSTNPFAASDCGSAGAGQGLAFLSCR